MKDYLQLIYFALDRAAVMEKSKPFFLRDFFPLDEWHALEKTTRRVLGKKFYAYACKYVPFIRPANKKGGRQQYEIVA